MLQQTVMRHNNNNKEAVPYLIQRRRTHKKFIFLSFYHFSIETTVLKNQREQ
jgi:hypothetical protein